MAAPKKKIVPDAFAVNRKAFHDYLVIETFEAGVALAGTEAKSVRDGRINLRDSYAKFTRSGELYLLNVHISPYQSHPGAHEGDPTRRRKLLLHKAELLRMKTQTEQKGLTMVPLKVYDVRSHIKVQIGMVKGKKMYDKKDDLKKKDLARDMKRDIKNYGIKI